MTDKKTLVNMDVNVINPEGNVVGRVAITIESSEKTENLRAVKETFVEIATQISRGIEYSKTEELNFDGLEVSVYPPAPTLCKTDAMNRLYGTRNWGRRQSF